MKKYLYLLFVLAFLFSNHVYGQNQWTKKFTDGDSVYFTDIKFLNNLTGFSVGYTTQNYYYLYKTTNAGENWSKKAGVSASLNNLALKFAIYNDSLYLISDVWTSPILTSKLTRFDLNWGSASTIFSRIDSSIYLPTFSDIINFKGKLIIGGLRTLYTYDGNWSTNNNANISVLKFSNSGDTLIAVSDSGNISTTYGRHLITKSTNYGLNWSLVKRFSASYFISDFSVHNNYAYCIVNPTSLYKINLFTSVETPLPAKATSEYIFCANNYFYISSGNKNITWLYDYNTNDTIPNKNYPKVFYKIYSYNDSTKWACSDGLYKNTEIVTSILPKVEDIETFILYQNYPNPFNPVTNIKFDVASLGDVKIIVYDVMGREVQTLVNERMMPGTYEATFDGTTLNSGVYFYKMITNGYSETRKMFLIK